MLSEEDNDEFELLNYLWFFQEPITHPEAIAIADSLVKKGYLRNLTKWVYQFTKEGSEFYKNKVKSRKI